MASSSATTTKLKKDGSLASVTGSTVEKQSHARHMAGKSTQDIDIMFVEGSINSSDTLIPTSTTGFVQIKFDGVEVLSSIHLESSPNQNHIACVNGLAMKQSHNTETNFESIPLSHVTFTGITNAESASLAGNTSYQAIEINKQFQQQLANISNITEQHERNYPLFCEGFLTSLRQYVFPLLKNGHTSDQMSEWNLNEHYFQDILLLTGPAYGYYLPQVAKVRTIALLNFYEKYKKLGNAQHIKERIEYLQECMPKETDIVPCFQLKFWPKDVHSFLDRISCSRPLLFDLIQSSGTSMHVIPKWSTKTPEVDKNIEFRYSFSFIERLLAENRSEKEQILNGIARSIYYLYLKNKCRLPSYFIKTSVLWMCEEINVDDFKEPKEIAQAWLKYACERLKEKKCLHYFIENLDIFEPYPAESLDEAHHILMNDVQPDELVDLKILDKQQEQMKRYNQNDQNFVHKLKVKDILNAIEDYSLLQEQWLDIEPTHTSITESNAAGCLYTLSTLRLIDGDDFQNWTEFRRIFLGEESSRCTKEPLGGEFVSKCSPGDFADSLMAVGHFLKAIYEAVSDPKFTGQCIGCSPFDFVSFQNLTQDLMNPENLGHKLISTWGPMFGANPEMLSSFIKRTPMDCHPHGPQLNINQNASITATNERINFSNTVSNSLVSLLQSASDPNMSLGDLIVSYQPNKQSTVLEDTDEQLLAYAIEMSLGLHPKDEQ